MKKIILSTVAALSLTGAALASESGDSYPQDQDTLFAVQRGHVAAPINAALDRAYGRTEYRPTSMARPAVPTRGYDEALSHATSELDRESSNAN